MSARPASPDQIADLRTRVACIVESAADHGILPFGTADLDGQLAVGGLSIGGLHEMTGATTSLADDAAATLFIAGIAARLAVASSAPVLWASTKFDLYAPGLEQAGLAPAKVIFAEPRDDAQLLAVVEDAVRDGSPAAVVAEVRRASMVATRRLQLAAGEAGVPVLLFRRWRRIGVDPFVEPSAAATRWRIGCAPSGPLQVAGIGRACWTVDLVRQRGGEPFSLTLEGCDGAGRLTVPAAPPRRAAATYGTAYHLAA